MLLLNNLRTLKMVFFNVWQIISLAIKYTIELLTSAVLCVAQLQGVAQGHPAVLHLNWLRVKLYTTQLSLSPPVHCFSA